MFDVIEISTNKIYRVYSVREEFCVHTRMSEFLIYKDDEWKWERGRYFKPITTKNQEPLTEYERDLEETIRDNYERYNE